MFLKCTRRKKDGKEHRYWNIVENKRCAGNRIVQRQVLYLGEINDSQKQSWCKIIDTVIEGEEADRQVALFPADRQVPAHAQAIGVQVRLEQMQLHRPRQWGGCWLANTLYEELQLDAFWSSRLSVSREGTNWEHILRTLVIYRLLDPGSEWRLHRQWFERSAMGDLLGEDYGLVEKNALYRCHDHLLDHKQALFSHLKERWATLFQAQFDVLLYDLTSTYFEIDPPLEDEDKRKHGYSRDKRSDCVQVVIALIVTPDGFPLAYEVLPGNTSDKTTLKDFLDRVTKQYGKARRTWVMDRGIPTEEVLEVMRKSDPPVSYLVGTPKGRLKKMEKKLLSLPWKEVRLGVSVKVLPAQEEQYVLAQSSRRIDKERAMRKRQLKSLVRRLREIQKMTIPAQSMLLKLGAAKNQHPAAWRLLDITLPEVKDTAPQAQFSFRLNWGKLRQVRRHEGRYLLRTNLVGYDPAQLWQFYMQLVEIEGVFRTLKNDLSLRPINHSLEHRIEAHIFISFLAYCLQVTLRGKLRVHASGLTPREVLEKFCSMQMVDVHLPTINQGTLILTRYTQPETEHQVLLQKLNLTLPAQPPPRIVPFEHHAGITPL